MKAYTFENGHMEKGILVTEKTEKANLGDFYARGQQVDFSIFYTERKVPESSSNDFASGLYRTSLVTIINQYVASDGSAFCLVKHPFPGQLCYAFKAYVLATSCDHDIEMDISLFRIDEGGHIELCEKVTADGQLKPVWRIYNCMGVLYCQRLHWDAPWSVDGNYLYARLDATSMVRIYLDHLNHITVESSLELLSDRGWVLVASSRREPDSDFVKGSGLDDPAIYRARLAARSLLARELTHHAEFLYQGRLSDPSVPLNSCQRC